MRASFLDGILGDLFRRMALEDGQVLRNLAGCVAVDAITCEREDITSTTAMSGKIQRHDEGTHRNPTRERRFNSLALGAASSSRARE